MQRFLMLFAALLVGCATAIAQPQSNDSPPLIAGRVSLAEGDVQIWRAEEDADGEWDRRANQRRGYRRHRLVYGIEWPHRVQSWSQHVSPFRQQAAVVSTSSTTAAQCSIWNTAR